MTGLPRSLLKQNTHFLCFQNGAPSQLDLFDYKPMLRQMQGQDSCKCSGWTTRLTGMTADQKKFPWQELYSIRPVWAGKSAYERSIAISAGVVDHIISSKQYPGSNQSSSC
ncbi:MAG: DUF1501 domain-containing protein [Chitinophagaceae bacterium]